MFQFETKFWVDAKRKRAITLNNYRTAVKLCPNQMAVKLRLNQMGFWRRIFLKFIKIFSLFRNYLPLEKDGVLHLNKFESPSPKDALCHVWLKWDQWF